MGRISQKLAYTFKKKTLYAAEKQKVAKVIYLSPYSPEFFPIENFGSKACPREISFLGKY